MLIPNKTWCSGSPLNVNFGERSQSGFRTETNINKYCNDGGMAKSTGIPSTYGFHYAWGKFISNIGTVSNNTIYAYLGMHNDSIGIINFSNLAGVKRASSSISGIGSIGVANKVSISAIAKLTSDIIALGTINADIAALVNMVAALEGTSNITIALGGISSAVCAITGSSTITANIIGSALISSDIVGTSTINADIIGSVYITASILASAVLNGDIKADAFISSDLYVGAIVDPLSPESLAKAVWNALADSLNNPDTAGELLLTAGSGGLSPEQVTMLQEIHKLLGLKSGSPVAITKTGQTVDDITLEFTGDGETDLTIERV